MGSGFKNIDFRKLWVAVVMVMTACIPDPLEVNGIPQLEQKIVVSSQMIPDLAVAVLLTKSIGALDASDDSDPVELLNQIIVTDAEVTLEGNGASYPMQHVGNGIYGVVGVQLVAGQSYSLFVNSPSMGSVQATTTVKPLVQFQDIETKMYFIGRDTLADIFYTIPDPVGKNWYMMTAQRLTARNIEERILNPWITTKLLDDTSFEGGIKQDNFKLLFDEVDNGDTLAVLLSNIDKDYYDFMKIREDTRFGLASYLGEPINYPTNVEGGLGFFNLYVPDVRVFILNEEEE
jgi:hypothetical protein